jgi:uncharacterized membrane protein
MSGDPTVEIVKVVSTDQGGRDWVTLRPRITAPIGSTSRWVALVFGVMSLMPTLLPRSPMMQGVITGLCVAIGLALGALLAWFVRLGIKAVHRSVPRPLGGHGLQLFIATTAFALVGGALLWVSQQNDQRRLVSMDVVAWPEYVIAIVVALVVGSVLFLFGRLVAQGLRRIDRAVANALPQPIAAFGGALVVATVVVTFAQGVVFDGFVSWANSTYGLADTGTPPGIERPTSPLRSGGPGSLVAWDSLGSEGRNFTGGGPTVAELQEFAGADAKVLEPIRVYVGLDSVDDSVDSTPAAEAQLAVAELERTGAFARGSLVIATVTGTGWVDPVSAAAFEFMHDGDTAIVATQFSFLPSWISFLVDLDKAAANGRALVDAVSARWRQLPADARPELFVFGESLGSYGSESAFESVDAMLSLDAATADATGVLWSGPTFANPIWHQVLRERVDSPVWHPRLGRANPVRVLGRPDDRPVPGPLTDGRHVTYLTHPSDPVTWASVDALWSKPPWMDRPTGYDVPAHPIWFPVVTFVQELFDLMAGFSAPPGHGHNYNPNQADGWASISAPPGWTAADTVRLDERIQTWAE